MQIVEHQQQRGAPREVREQGRQACGHRLPLGGRLTGIHAPQGDQHGSALGRRKPGQLPVLDVGQQLDEGGVRQLELPLRRPARQRADATCRRVRGDRLDEGRLADAGLPLQQQRARTVAKVVQEPRGGVHLGLSLEDHLGGSGEFGESAEPSAAGNMRFATYRARHPSTHAIVGFAS
ncbi:MAG: hypothetical protein U0237_09965 [Thermoleophilia bacterium]